MRHELAYTVTLLRQNMAPEHCTFARLSEAIRWLGGALEAADLQKSYGEIRVNGEDVLWRRGNAELASDFYLSNELSPELALDADSRATEDVAYGWERFYR
jgi:hypothetical protein